MGMATHLFLRGTMWTWRRRWPGFSTKTRHLQLSLRTHDRAIARILASRLTYESNRMFDAITLGELSPAEAKAWLESVIRTELHRVERQRMIARLDPMSAADDPRYDWATAQAWRLFAERGLNPALSPAEARTLDAEGASAPDLAALAGMLDLLGRDVTSEAGVNKMIAAAREALSAALGAPKLQERPSAMTILQLRQFLIAGKAAAWQASNAMPDPHLDWARDFALALVQSPRLPEGFSTSTPGEVPLPAPLPDPGVITPLPRPQMAPLGASALQRPLFDPNLLALVERINADKDRKSIKIDTRKQLVSGAKLFIAATGVERVTDIDQQHLKYFKGVLQNLPKSYGKSPKDSERSIAEILERAKTLPEDQVGLSARTINGHLDRFSLIFRVARSENLKISGDIQIELLRVRETKRARDKRAAFSPEQVRTLFEHPIWTGSTNHKRRHVPGKLVLKDGLFWGPLLAAYSGARREEVLGLAPEDFDVIEEIPCYHIRDNANRGVKTLSSERIIPIHPHLVDLGLLKHVAKARAKGERAIFPELISTNDTESFGDKIFYNWDKALDIQFDGNPEGLCFHSFRHYVISFLKRDATVTDKLRRDLVGHVGKDAHDENYDEASTMTALLPVVERLPRVF